MCVCVFVNFHVSGTANISSQKFHKQQVLDLQIDPTDIAKKAARASRSIYTVIKTEGLNPYAKMYQSKEHDYFDNVKWLICMFDR